MTESGTVQQSDSIIFYFYSFFFSSQHLPNLIVGIRVMGNRVFVSDVQEGIQFVKYKPQENQLVIFADETIPRWVWQYSTIKLIRVHFLFVIAHVYRFITASCILDYSTLASADKFGNVAVVGIVMCTQFCVSDGVNFSAVLDTPPLRYQ